MEQEIISSINPVLIDIWSFLFPNKLCGGINLLIFFLLFLTYFTSTLTIQRYRKQELNELNRVKKKVDKKLSYFKATMESGEEKTEEEFPGENSIDKKKKQVHNQLMAINELREGIHKDSVIYNRLDIIERMRDFRVKIDADFLQQTTINSESKRLGTTISGFSTNLALILGLFGTFIGLALMVTKINMLLPNPNSFSISTLKSSIAGMDIVFQGIKTAFSTSIVGISTTIICLYLTFRIRRNQTAFFHELETFTVEKLIPVTVPTIQGEHPLEKISFQLKDSFDDLEQIISQNKDTIENLSTIQSSFKTIVDEVRDITKREASRNFEGVLTLLTKSNESMTGIVQQWPKVFDAMKVHSRLTENKIDSLIDIIKKKQETFDKELNRILQIRQGGAVINIPNLSSAFIIVSSIVIIVTLFFILR